MYGFYKTIHMSFGLCNARAVHYQLVAQIMDSLGLELVAHYPNDVLITL